MYDGQPENIRIMGLDYYIDIYPRRERDSYGVCHHDTHTIGISNCNSEEHAKSVLLHEILEALNYRLELNMDHTKITALEAGLFQVMRDNPKLMQFLEKQN